MRSLIRAFQRLLILGLGVLSIWLIVDVFHFVDRRLPWILALALTYGIAAYFILPRVVRMGLGVLQRKRVPRYTVTGDGLPGDPVNLALIGDLAQLRGAFAQAGWSEADRLGLASSWRMVRAFVLNKPYPSAPFSTLYLFGRGQDIGFQKAIDNSPRKRHHVRFWAMSAARAQQTVGTAAFWLDADCPSADERVLWAGAGTKDTGLSLTQLTFQVTHATDADTNAERDYIVAELTRNRVVEEVTLSRSGDEVGTDHINRYVADGDVAVASLAADLKASSSATSAAGEGANLPSVSG
jgi:LssY C-terminus